MKLIIKQFFAMIWRYFDVMCFIFGMIAADYGLFMIGKPWGVIGIAVVLFLVGWLSEVISANKKGDD